MENTRTVLVVWSWNKSGLGEGIWDIAGASHANDHVVCWDKVASEESFVELKQMAISYIRNNGELMIFLHRSHRYTQDHIKELMQLALSSSVFLKCFLFGEGAEGIYLTNDTRGLLGTAGTFSAKINREGQSIQRSSVADKERKELKPAHFDYVWEQYKFSLRRQIFELKEDMLEQLFLQKTEKIFAPGELYTILNKEKNRLLLLRVLSFIGRIHKNSNLAKEIRTFERNTNRTFTFYDCKAHLESSYGMASVDDYVHLAGFILKNILSKGDTVDLLDLRSRFDALLIHVFESTNYQ